MIHAYLATFNLFTEAEIEDFSRLFTRQKLGKSDYFVREGQSCKEVAFILSGIFRSFYVSGTGDELTYCFRFPGDLMAAYSSFITGSGSVENMQALCAAELLVVKKEAIERLVNTDPKWIQFARIIAEQQYIELENRIFQLQRDSALERYRALVKEHPEYIRNIPLQYLASYLGITQRHLSRIRKEVSF